MDELVYFPNNVRVSPLVGVPDDGIGVSSLDFLYNSRAICRARLPGTPEYTARCDIGEEKREARSDTRSSCNYNDSLEQLRSVEKSVEGSTTDPQLSLVGLHDLLLGPVTRVTDDNTETVDLSRFRVNVRDGSKGVPLGQRLVTNLEAVEGCHSPILEVQACGVVAKLLGVHSAMT